MSTVVSSPARTVTPVVKWWMAPVAVWRLLRVFVHLVIIVLKAVTIWRVLSEAKLDSIKIDWSGKLLRILGIKLVVQGQARPGAKLVVANHVSWLDIVAINSVVPSRFVSKAEVANWPLLGRLVTAAGTLYLVRERRRDAMRVLGLIAKGLQEGHTVAVFPEGTTGDGHGVMHFHPNMLQALTLACRCNRWCCATATRSTPSAPWWPMWATPACCSHCGGWSRAEACACTSPSCPCRPPSMPTGAPWRKRCKTRSARR